MSFLGSGGVADRMAQIQSRLDALSPREARPEVRPNPSLGANASFGKTLDAALGEGPVNPLSLGINPVVGTIGGHSELQSMADAAADRHGLDRSVFRALVQQESGWNAKATSRVGAKGLCQLMDGTARELGVSDPYDPAQSLEGGARYLRRMMDVNHGDETRALASYNAGFGRVNGRSRGEWPQETQQYVTRILSHARANAA